MTKSGEAEYLFEFTGAARVENFTVEQSAIASHAPQGTARLWVEQKDHTWIAVEGALDSGAQRTIAPRHSFEAYCYDVRPLSPPRVMKAAGGKEYKILKRGHLNIRLGLAGGQRLTLFNVHCFLAEVEPRMWNRLLLGYDVLFKLKATPEQALEGRGGKIDMGVK